MTTRDEWTNYIGEGIHAALRKAGQSPEAHEAYRAIAAMPTEDWDRVLCYLVDGLAMMGEITVTEDDDG